MSDIGEISKFLSSVEFGKRCFLGKGTLNSLASLMNHESNVVILKEFPFVLETLLSILVEDNEELRNLAAITITNITSFHCGALEFLQISNNDANPFIKVLLQLALDSTCSVADRCSEIVSNVSVFKESGQYIAQFLMENTPILDNVIDAIIIEKFNKKGCLMDYLSIMIGNLTQISTFRRFLLTSKGDVLSSLLALHINKTSALKKQGIFSVLKNCCFEIDSHEILLKNFNVAVNLLYPIAGSEEVEEDVSNKFPLELQYLPIDKEREPDVENRKMLLEALLKLCATKYGREFLRSINSYCILKSYHMWEHKEENQTICEDIIGLLIRTEEEIGIDNLSTLEIPPEIQDKFNASNSTGL